MFYVFADVESELMDENDRAHIHPQETRSEVAMLSNTTILAFCAQINDSCNMLNFPLFYTNRGYYHNKIVHRGFLLIK